MAKHAHTTPTSTVRRTARTSAYRGRKPPVEAALPDMPPLSDDEVAHKQWITAELRKLAAKARQVNLDNAVILAQQAARQGGELADHFAEIGRRFGHLLKAPPKPRLRVVKDGAA